MIQDTSVQHTATPPSVLHRLRRRVFGLSPDEASFARRGFLLGERGAQQRLEQIGQTFLYGYHATLEDDDFGALSAQLDLVERELRGFAYEGAAMGLTILDALTPWRGRLAAFLQGSGAAHIYMAHVGAGWAYARLHRRFERALGRLDPLLGWLALDGYGFHEGYFHWRRTIVGQRVPRQLSDYARRVFDQGLGRSLWFVVGADTRRIPDVVARFAPARRSDLWSGLGLACTYAGGVGQEQLAALVGAAGPYRPQMAQGAAFAAKTRLRAGNPTAHTELACRIVCERSADEAAQLTDRALDGLPFDGPTPAYEVWRQRIQASFEGR